MLLLLGVTLDFSYTLTNSHSTNYYLLFYKLYLLLTSLYYLFTYCCWWFCYWLLFGMRSFLIMFFVFYLLKLSIKADCNWLLFVNNLSFKDIYKYESFFVDWVPVGWLGLRFGFGYKDCRVKYWLFIGCCLSQLPSVNTLCCFVLL